MKVRKILLNIFMIGFFVFMLMGGLQIIGVIDYENTNENYKIPILELGKKYVAVTEYKNISIDNEIELKEIVVVNEIEIYRKRLGSSNILRLSRTRGKENAKSDGVL